MALLALASRVREPAGLLIASVNHGLRAAAETEIHGVEALCATLGLRHSTLDLGALPETGNLSANLRDARYAALADWARDQRLSTVLLGHTMDDQAETVLMRLARGSGVEGLSGMTEIRHTHGIDWVRPLLGLRREDLRGWLRAEGVPWHDDPTNEDDSFDRIKARRALSALAPMGITADGLARTATRLQRQRAVLEDAMSQLAQQARRMTADGYELDRDALRRAMPDTGLRLLADSLMQVGGQPYRPRFRALEPLFQRILTQSTFRATLAGCLIETTPERVKIRREHA